MHDLRSRIAARTADVEAARAAAPQAQLRPPGASVANEAPTWLEPVILVLIDGCVAFARLEGTMLGMQRGTKLTWEGPAAPSSAARRHLSTSSSSVAAGREDETSARGSGAFFPCLLAWRSSLGH